MKLLLDENLPHRLRNLFAGHDVFTATFMKWNGIQNGQLLELAGRNGFDAIITIDRGIAYQHNLTTLACSVVVLKAISNALPDVAPLVPQILAALKTLKPGTIVRIA